MAVQVDTSVQVELERGRSSLGTHHLVGEGAPTAKAAITISEMLTGACRSIDPAERPRRIDSMDSVLLSKTVMTHGLTLVSHDARHFTRVAGLEFFNPPRARCDRP